MTGRPHVACVFPSDSQSEVYYACRTGQTWQRTRLTANHVYDRGTTIALEADRIPHIAWITVDPDRHYHIAYATNRAGAWQNQVLQGSQLGGFGLGAAPYLALEPTGIAHISYRGGDYQDYHIHHAQNSAAGDTSWTFEVLSTANVNDFTSALCARDSGELSLVASGNDYWGAPWRSCYLHRPRNSMVWDPYELMTGTASAALRGFATDGPFLHISYERIDGNVATEEIYHCSNAPGTWFRSPIRTDGETSSGALVVDQAHCGHCLLLSGPHPDSQQVYCLHSAPFTAIAQEPAKNPHDAAGHLELISNPTRAPVRFRFGGEKPARASIYSKDGRLVQTIVFRPGRPVQSWAANHWHGTDPASKPILAGSYVIRCDGQSLPFVVLR